MAVKFEDKPGYQNDGYEGQGSHSTPDDSYNPQTTPLMDPSDPRGDLDTVRNQEAAGATDNGDNPATDLNTSSSDKLGRGFEKDSEEPSGRVSRIGKKFKLTRRRSLFGIAAGSIVGGGLFGFSIIQGPAQFVHFAQLMQKFHLQQNEDFGDERTSKVLLYSLLGRGTERGRLGMVANKAADAWEKKLEEKTGLRPLYTQRTGRFLGYGIIDDKKFSEFAGGFDEKNTKKMEKLMGKGVEIRDASSLSTDQRVTWGGGDAVPGNVKVLDASKLDRLGDRRTLVRTIGRATTINAVPTALATRLAEKRYGIDFHVANKIRVENDKLETRKKKAQEVLKDWYNTNMKGVKPGNGLGKDTSTDGEGNPAQTTEDQAASDTVEAVKEEIEKQVPENAGSEAAKSVRGRIIKGAGGTAAVAVGVLCTAKDYGNGIQEYKYINYVLPMMRIGMNLVSLGNQVMSGDNISLADLNIFSDLLYDEETKTSLTSAVSIHAQNGEPQTGASLPEEAQLGNVSEKPEIFQRIDSIPVLGTACAVSNAISGLPIIKQVNDATGALVNSVTNLDDLVEKSFAIVAGQGVDPLSKGGNLGAIADAGVFLAGNDQAVSMGGAALTPAQTAELRKDQDTKDAQEKSTQSIAQRYLDPYSMDSVFGSFINKTPANTTQLAAIFITPLKPLGNMFSSAFSSLIPGAHAATIGSYDYGVPKYGFSLEERQDDRFEDPYQNAQIVEPMLDGLNAQYSKCFSITISNDDTGVHIESGEAANVFELQKDHPECDPAKNNDPNFLRYRFYIADSVMAISMACYEANDDNACQELGLGSGGATTDSSVPIPGGNLEANKDKFTEILKLPAGAIGPPEIGFYHQCQDQRWADKPYPYASGGSNTICASACGPTSIAMAVSTLGSEIINPEQMAQKAKQWHVQGGTAMSGAITLVEQYGLKYQKLPASGNAIKQVLSSGGFVIMNANSGSPFTQAGHFIVIRGISDDGTKFWVADPADDNGNGQNRNQQAWPVSSISGWLGPDGLYAVEKK